VKLVHEVKQEGFSIDDGNPAKAKPACWNPGNENVAGHLATDCKVHSIRIRRQDNFHAEQLNCLKYGRLITISPRRLDSMGVFGAESAYAPSS